MDGLYKSLKMHNAELYQRSSCVQKRDARQCLEECAEKIKWKKCGAAVIDIGYGDGGVTTNILKTFIPDNCKVLVGCDISEKMVEFANAHHAKDFVSFEVLDIESDLPDQFRKKFDHAFSFNALHWIQHQEIAFSNIYNLLAGGGGCLLLFLGYMPLYEVFRELARAPRWNYWMRNVESFVSPYHKRQDNERNIKELMTTIGFTNLEVTCLQREFVYSGVEIFKNSMSAINPFKIPLESQDDFLEDFVKIVRDMEFSSIKVDDSFNVKIYYTLIRVYGEK